MARFALACWAPQARAAALHQMQAMLTALQPRLDGNEDPAVRDNAVGRSQGWFRPILTLAQIVPAIVTSLPLQADCGENIPSCRCLMALAQDENARGHLGPHMPQVLSVMATLANRENTDKLATAAAVRDYELLGVAAERRAGAEAVSAAGAGRVRWAVSVG